MSETPFFPDPPSFGLPKPHQPARGQDASKRALPVSPDLQAAAIARENCFERLYMRFRERLLKYARRRGNPDEAEDLVEDVYVGLWTNDSEMPCGPNEKKTEEYLVRSVKNRLIDEVRSQKSKGSFLDDLAAFIENMLWKVAPASWRAERDDIRRHLERVLKKLPERCREVFRLRRLCELSIEETATELGISAKTVRLHLTRANKLLHDEFAPLGYDLRRIRGSRKEARP